MLKWLYDIFGWCYHDWGMWENSSNTTSYYEMQERRCKKCGFYQIDFKDFP